MIPYNERIKNKSLSGFDKQENNKNNWDNWKTLKSEIDDLKKKFELSTKDLMEKIHQNIKDIDELKTKLDRLNEEVGKLNGLI